MRRALVQRFCARIPVGGLRVGGLQSAQLGEALEVGYQMYLVAWGQRDLVAWQHHQRAAAPDTCYQPALLLADRHDALPRQPVACPYRLLIHSEQVAIGSEGVRD